MAQNSIIAENGSFTLYSAVGSRGLRVEKLFDLMAIPYDLVRVSIAKKEHKTPSYLEDIHPMGLVPALKHEGRVILESGAIMLYIADLFPKKLMCPEVGTHERGEYYEWFMFTLATIEPLMANIMSKRGSKSESQQRLQDTLRVVNNRIRRPYLLGERFSAADVLLHSEIHWIKKYFKGINFSQLHGIEEYYGRLMKRLNWD